MVNARRKARELALQMLYQQDMVQGELEQCLDVFGEGGPIPEQVKDFALLLVRGALDNREEIDEHIEAASRHWSLKRMPLIDKNILRMAIYELKHLRDIPYKVTINEAVEIAKKYGGEASPSFVNGVLDRVSKGAEAGC